MSAFHDPHANRVPKYHTGAIRAVKVFPERRRMVTLTGPYDNMVHLWDLKTRRIRKGIVIRYDGVVVSRDGQLMVSSDRLIMGVMQQMQRRAARRRRHGNWKELNIKPKVLDGAPRTTAE